LAPQGFGATPESHGKDESENDMQHDMSDKVYMDQVMRNYCNTYVFYSTAYVGVELVFVCLRVSTESSE